MVSAMIAAALESNSADVKSLIADASKSKVEMKEATKNLCCRSMRPKRVAPDARLMCLAKVKFDV